MSTTIRLSTPADIIEACAYLLRHRPHESVVAVSTDGRVAARVDLNPAEVDSQIEDLLDHLPGEVVLVLFTDEPIKALPYLGFQARTDGRFRDLRDHDWRPLTPSHRVAAEFTYLGHSPAPDRDSLIPDLSATTPAVPSGNVADGILAWYETLHHGAPLDHSAVHGALSHDPLLVRDALLASGCIELTPARLTQAALRHEEAGKVFEEVMTATTRPEPDRLQNVSAMLVDLTRTAFAGRSHLIAALAFLAWYGGNTAAADLYLQQVTGPYNRLAALVRQALDVRFPPPWA